MYMTWPIPASDHPTKKGGSLVYKLSTVQYLPSSFFLIINVFLPYLAHNKAN